MINELTRNGVINRYGVVSLGAWLGVAWMFTPKEIPSWIPLCLSLLVCAGTAIGYAIFPKTISTHNLFANSELGLLCR